MSKIYFNAFSFLKSELKEMGIECPVNELEIPDGINVKALIEYMGISKDNVEAAFINHKIEPMDKVIKDGDRVALVPPGGIPAHVAAYVGKNNK